MKFRNQEIAQRFVAGATEGESHTGAFSIHDNKLFSYGTLLAVRRDNGVELNVTKYSSTTSKQQRYLYDAIDARNIKILKVYQNVPMWTTRFKEDA